MRRGLLGLVVAMGLAIPAWAQPARDDAAARRVLAERYARDIHMDEVMTRVMTAITHSMYENISKQQAGIDQTKLARLSEITDHVMALELPKLQSTVVEQTSLVYDRDELQALVDFYESPVGVKIVSKMAAASEASQIAVRKLMPDITAELHNEVCAAFGCQADAAPATRKPS